MATSPYPIAAQSSLYAALSLAAVTACTTRAPTPTASLAAANILPLTATSTNGIKVDSIVVSAAASAIGGATTAGLVGIWMWDGVAGVATLIAEIAVTAVTPSATTAAFSATWTPLTTLTVPAANRLYASTTVTTTAAANALSVEAFGGVY